MDRDLPNVFKGSFNKKIDNNKNIFYSKYDEVRNFKKEDRNIEIDQFNFNRPVEIITKDKMINTKIVSRVGDHIMIATGEEIKIKDIVSIVTKQK